MNSPEILFCADEIYARPLAVALGSALDHAPPQATVTVVLDGFRTAARAELERASGRHSDVAVSFLDAAQFDRSGLAGARHLSPAAYLRLFLDEIYPDSGKVLFLDSDVLVRRPLAPLFDVDLGGKTVGAVQDMVIPDLAYAGLAPGAAGSEHYFNSGVLLVDLARWREQEIGTRALRLGREQPSFNNADQDLLNHVLSGDWAELDPTWNVQGGLLLLHEQPSHPRREELQAQQAVLLRDAAIVHFSAIKPWHASSRHPFRKEWRRYARRAYRHGRLRWELDLVGRRAAVALLEATGLRERRERLLPDPGTAH